MIFVTVGHATQRFRRLLEAVDAFAGAGGFNGELVIMQSGHNDGFAPRHASLEPFMTMEDFARRLAEESLIITHAGCGTLLEAIRLGKRPVVMPRRAAHGEHVNDHQLQLVSALAEEGRVIPAYEPADLPAAVAEARRHPTQDLPRGPCRLLKLVDRALQELGGKITQPLL